MSKTGIYLNGEWYGGTSGANAQDISYSDFENLTQAQKDNGTIYFIPDYPLPTVAIKPWATATDAELVAMVQAADAGDIDLYEDAGWRVGDERVVHLSAMSATGVGESHAAQDVTFVLMHRGLYKDVNDKTVNFVVGMKNCLAEKGYISSANTNAGSWRDTSRRGWCNETFKNAIPSSLIGIFKQVKVITGSSYDGTSNIITNDYFFLPAAAEIFKGDSTYGTGTSQGQATAYSNWTEFNTLSRFTWYENKSNMHKSAGSEAPNWWNRSVGPMSTRFCDTTQSGTADNGYDANSLLGISVHGCI